MKTRYKMIIIGILIPVTILGIMIFGIVPLMYITNGYSGFIMSVISDEEFEEEFAKISEVKLFIEKYPNYTTSHSADFLGWKIINYDASIGQNAVHLSVKKSVIHQSVKVSAGCSVGEAYSYALNILDDEVKDYLKNDICLEKPLKIQVCRGGCSDVKILQGAVMEGNESLDPEVVIVVLGKNNTVTWINNDDTGHGLVSNLRGMDFWRTSGILKPGESFSNTFNKSGIFPYHGQPHPWISGAVIVVPANYDENKLPSSNDYDFQRMYTHNACTEEHSFCFGAFENGTQIMTQCDFPIHGCGPVSFDSYVEEENEN